MTNPCPFVGDKDHVPEGPNGDDLVTCRVKFHGGEIMLIPGAVIRLIESSSDVPLRKIRRCENGEVYGMVEFPDGGLLWTSLAPIPTPKLTEWQIEEINRIKNKIPVLYHVTSKIGDRVSRCNRMGTVVFVADGIHFSHECEVVAMDDGSISLGDSVACLLHRVEEGKA